MFKSILGYDIVQIVGRVNLDGNVARRIRLFEDSLYQFCPMCSQDGYDIDAG